MVEIADPFIGTVASRLPSELHMRSYRQFIDAVQRRSGNNATSAGILIQNLIVNRLQKKVRVPNATLEVKQTLAKRLKYFKSPAFLKNFTSTVPVRDRWEQNSKATSYSDWLNTLFNVSFGSWREEELIRPSNQQQCIGALGELGRDVPLLQNTIPHRICYLCGREIRAGEPTMECEHVLPVITALSHIWLAQERIATYTKEELKILRLEYAWSHKCCNRIKSNYDFIILNGNRYVVNQPLINAFSAAVDAGPDSLSCNQITNIPKFLPNVGRPLKKNKLMPRIAEILEVINKNIANFNNIDLYLLWTKYKILFALTEESLLNAITGDGTLITATPAFRDPEAIARKRAREAEVAAEEAAFWNFKKEGPARRAAQRAAAEAAAAGVQGGGGDHLTSSNGAPAPADPQNFLVSYDEDVTFPNNLLHYLGDVEHFAEFILTLPLPNLDADLDLAMGPTPPVSYIDITIKPSYNPKFGYKQHIRGHRDTKKSNAVKNIRIKHRFSTQRFTQKRFTQPKYVTVMKKP